MLDVILANQKSSLCMGDATDAVSALDGSRFHLVFFCAQEFPPPPQVFKDPRQRRARVYHVRLDDAVLSKDELFAASRAADLVTGSFLQGSQILITCMQGRNRSGLVAALALHMLSGAGGKAAMRAVRERRVHVEAPALVNPSFVTLLENIPPKDAARARGIRIGTEEHRPVSV